MTRRTPRPRAYAPDPDAPGRPCDCPGCAAPGEYRAPKSRTTLNAYWWFCLEHVRAYNAAWDFYKGMTPGQIEAQSRRTRSGSGPPGRSAGSAPASSTRTRCATRWRRCRPPPPRAERAAQAPTELREPLTTLGLDWPVSLDVVKTRYKELAKRHHPDANGGDRAAEERLKTINLAYAAVRSHLAADPARRRGIDLRRYPRRPG